MAFDLQLPDENQQVITNNNDGSNLNLPDQWPKTFESYNELKQVDPDKTARVKKLTEKFDDIDPVYVESNLDAVEKEAQTPSISFFDELEKDYPGTTKFLSKKENMAVAKDDMENLSFFERHTKSIGREYDRGSLNVQIAEIGFQQLWETLQTGEASTYKEAEINDLQNKSEKLGPEPTGIQPLSFAAQQVPNFLLIGEKVLKRGGLGAVGGAIGGATYGSIVPGYGTLAGAISGATAGAGTGATAGAFEASLILEGGLAYDEFKKIPNVTPRQRAAAALVVGGINAGLELATLQAMVKVIPGGGALLDKFVSKAPVLQNFGKERILSYMKNYLASIATEAATEFGQEFVSSTGGQILEGDIKIGEGLKRSVGVISPALQSAALFGFPGTAFNITSEVRKARKAQVTKNAYIAMGDTVENSKLKERLPESHRDFVNEVTKNGPVENIYIPRQEFETYWQEKNIDPGIVAEELGISDQYETEASAGTDLKIKTSTFTDKVVGTEHYQGLADNIKFDPEDYTVNQWNERQETIKQDLEAEQQKAQEIIQQQYEKKRGYDEVYNYIVEGQRQAGINNENEIEANAQLWASHAVVESARQGITTQEWFQGINRPEIKQSSKWRPVLFQRGLNEVDQTDFALPENVQITKHETETLLNPKEGNKIIEDFVKRRTLELRGLNIVNQNTGENVLISGAGINKTISHGISKLKKRVNAFNEHFQSLERIDQLIQNGVFLTKSEDNKNRNKSYRYLFSPMNLNGKNYLVKITLKETEQGLSFYSHDVVTAEDQAVSGQPNENVLDGTSSAEAIGIDEFLNAVNSKRQEKSFFQGDDKKRGSVSFPQPNQAIITLFKAKDQSTFIHESAHIWLKDTLNFIQSGQASDKYLQDWETLKDWLEFKDNQKNFTVDQQEKFARGFEAYVREGAAPSTLLEKSFRRFKRWLTRIYDSVEKLNVELSDEVREVMSRMLASEVEIEEAVTRLSSRDQLRLQGIPEATIEKLDALREKARDKAERTLLKEQMKELTAENKKVLDYERAWATEQGRKLLEGETIYIVMNEIGDEFNTKNSTALSQKYLDGKMTIEDAERFELIANFMGFGSGSEMANFVTTAKPFKVALQEIVDAHMQQFANLKDTPAIKQRAMEVIHNKYSLELLALEEDILNKDIQGDAAKQATTEQIRLRARRLKEEARKIIEKKSYKDLSRLNTYITNERNAAVKAAKAYANGKFDDAIKFKQQQTLNHALYWEAVKAKREIEKSIKYLDKQRKGKRESWANYIHFEQAAKILDRFGFSRKDFEKTGNEKPLALWAQEMEQETGIVDLQDWLFDESISINYRDMNSSQIKDVSDAVKNIKKVANYLSNALTIDKGAKFDDIEAGLIESQQKSGESGKKPPLSKKESFTRKFSRKIDQVNFSILSVETLLRGLDRFEAFGNWWRAIYKPIQDAANQKVTMLQDAAEKYRAIFSVYTKEELKKIDNDLIYLEEIKDSLTKSEILAMALNWGNEINRERLMTGRNWNESQIKSIFDKHLDERDWNTVQNILNLINSYWGQISQLYIDLTGFSPKKVESLPIQTNYGVFDGGYFPLKRDPRVDIKGYSEIEVDASLAEQAPPTWKAMTKNGHTKERVKNASYPVSLDLSVIQRHLHDVIHDLTHRKAILDVSRILAREKVQQSIIDAYGIEGFTTIKNWQKDIAGSNLQPTINWLNSLAGWVRKNTVIAAMGFRLSTMFQQFTGFFSTVAVDKNFGWRDMTTAVWDFYGKTLFSKGKYSETYDYVLGKSSYMRDRIKTLDRDIADTAREIFGKKSGMSEFAMAGIAAFDRLVTIPTWMQAYKVGVNLYSDEQQAIDYADLIVRRSQGSGLQKDLPAIMRGTNGQKLLTMFYSYMNNQYNLFYESYKILGLTGNINEFIGRMMALWIFPVVFSEFLAFRAPLGDDEQENEKLKFWTSKLIQYPLSTLPVIRDVGTVLVDASLGLPGYGFRPTPGTAVIDAGERMIRAWGSDSSIQQKLEATTKVASLAAPYPDQFNAWFWNSMDIMINGMDVRPGDFVRRRPKRERNN